MAQPTTHPVGIPVSLPGRSVQYEVLVGSDLLPELGDRLRAVVPHTQAAVVLDEAIAQTHGRRVTEALQQGGYAPTAIEAVPASESAKVMTTYERLLSRFLSVGLDRRCPVIAVGGGIVSDLAGFAAATYLRGVPFVVVPTTLLAMVDASVGGKTGVNAVIPTANGTTLGKNLIGAFHQPSLVVADIGTLTTLPDRTWRAGLAECVKHALLADEPMLRWLEENAPARCTDVGPQELINFVAGNVRIKASIVQQDGRETFGPRMLLNLGHTFAHAIESCPDLGVMHGEAVALGVLASCAAGRTIGLTVHGLDDRIEQVLVKLGLPTTIAGLGSTDSLITTMTGDKKASAKRIRIVIPITPGQARIVENVGRDAIEAGWSRIRAG